MLTLAGVVPSLAGTLAAAPSTPRNAVHILANDLFVS
jgi:hypothetical protein